MKRSLDEWYDKIIIDDAIGDVIRCANNSAMKFGTEIIGDDIEMLG